MTVCAIYARVSDDSQLKGDSIEHQISYCRENARRRSLDDGTHWLTPDAFIYVDEGITGTSMIKRAAVQRLIRDARAHQFEVVLFKGISRFARDTVDALLMLRTLTACGVRVVSMEENFDSQHDNAEFIFTIHSALAQAESEKTAIRVRVGASQKAQLGKWNGQAPDGFILNRETKHLEIDETFAPVIRDIFNMYLGGYGARKITHVLNNEGRYTKRGNLWTQRNISRLLRNPVYVGDVVYGRREKRMALPDASDPLARKKRAVWVNDPQRLTVCENAHPGIVSRDVFQKVQETMNKRRPTSGPTDNGYLLTKGLLMCRCGSAMTINYNPAGTAYYRCIRKRESGQAACNSGYIRAHDLEQAVLSSIRTEVLEAIQYEGLVIPQPSTEENEQQLKLIRDKIALEIDRSQQLFDKYTDGLLLDEQYLQMNKTIQARLKSLQRNRDHLMHQIDAKKEELDAERLIRQAMKDFLSVDTTDARLTREILKLFVVKVTVLDGTGGSKQIRIDYRFEKPLHSAM
ncbi:recombinase family protein [Alicyclobacillus sp. SO9]|uniref:recombinase family protein n=1 Tax=Alicyclobacillus sp. SO9 TaxID=2665646 RepID=UPI0018E7942A|nr:recombinase family protein [Alicyclobacillus sp. SO9]QQE77749.1 recombinase family protein [Alicyclobacillus sp. SO9]